MRYLFGRIDRRSRFPVLVLGAALASLVWLLVMTSTVTSPGKAREQRAAPRLPTPAAALVTQRLRQVTWAECRRQSIDAGAMVPPPPPGYRSVVTALAATGSKVTTGTVLARVSGRPLIAVVTSEPLYRDMVLGDRGPDVLGVEKALAAAELITRTDGVLDTTTLAAWRRLDSEAPADRIPLDRIVAVGPNARVGDVRASVGDTVKPGSTLVQLFAASPSFTCEADRLPSGLTPDNVKFEVHDKQVPVAEIQARPNSLRIRPKTAVDASEGRAAITFADSLTPVLTAPLSAIRVAADGQPTVLLLDGDGATGKKIDVTLGVTAQGMVAVTGDGLKAGDRVELFNPRDAPSAQLLGGE